MKKYIRILMVFLILFLVLAGTYKLMNARNFQLLAG